MVNRHAEAARPTAVPAAAPSHSPAWLRSALLGWYDRQRRELPWRAEPGMRPDPYRIWVSEIMLQQTTAATVSQRYAAFLERFPTLADLAAASQAEVLHAWQGLGYYRRARALHAAAQAVVARHGAALPDDEAALRALPGIGAYTAAAIRAIAFEQPVLPVDGNVERVLARLRRIETPLPAAAKALRAASEALAAGERPGDFAQAMMDLGATVCRPTSPVCLLCPWRAACAAHAAGLAEALPRRAAKPERPIRRGVAFLARRSDGAVLFRERPPEGLLGGLHELPSSPWREGPLAMADALEEAPLSAEWRLTERRVRHVFTHFVLELTLAEADVVADMDGLWLPPAEWHRLALPSVMVKLLRAAGFSPRQTAGRSSQA